MELNEAIKELKDLRKVIQTAFWNKEYIIKKSNAIDTVLIELNRLQKANETLNSFIEWGTNPFVKEIKEGNNEQV